MRIPTSLAKRFVSAVTAVALTTVGLTAVTTLALAPAASADILPTPAPVEQRAANGVTADALPTVQIDSGVVWTQVVIGNTVYAGGSFSQTRPAGAAAGTNLTPRGNLLAFDITTGNLKTSFAPVLNGQVKALAKSPDGSRVYVGGQFTTADGQARFNLAAYSTSTGALITTFKPAIGGSYVNAIAVTDTAVYIGGLFTKAQGITRTNLAALNPTTGAVLNWAPVTDLQVDAMVMTPTNNKVIIGGRFSTVNGASQRGLAALDTTTGAVLPWIAPSIVVNGYNTAPYVGKAGIFSLSSDGVSIFGTGWVYATAAVGNLEGAFSAEPESGSINWIEDCHGDTYSAYSDKTTVYTTSHAHACESVGGFNQSNPSADNLQHSVAFTAAAKGTLSRSPWVSGTYKDWSGTPAPAVVDWFPEWVTGSATGQGQSGWTTVGNGTYVVVGGEFPYVNGKLQQGLVRFGIPSASGAKDGPRLASTRWVPKIVSLQPGSARISIPDNWDRDDMTLTYEVVRTGTATPIATSTKASTFWQLGTQSWTDTGLVAGNSYTYRVRAIDSNGNVATSAPTTVTVTTTPASQYLIDTFNDGAGLMYRLDEAADATAFDWAGVNDGVIGTDVTRGTAGAIIGDTDTAMTFNGNVNSRVLSSSSQQAPDTFSAEVWIKTNTTTGGKILGFGNGAQTASSGSYDRHIYMTNNGRIVFGAYPGAVKTVTSAASYNDNSWHHIVATLGADGMRLYVDSIRVGFDASVTSGQVYAGYWHIGGDNLGSWTNAPSNANFTGSIDDAAIYPTVLTRNQVRQHFVDAGYTPNVPAAPADAYGAAVYAGDPDFYWRLNQTSGSVILDSGTYGNPGSGKGTLTYNQTGAINGTTDKAIRFNGSNSLVVSSVLVTNPTTYTESAWFKTSTTTGGKIIGFGDAANGLSSNYDRHVYMQNDGTIAFGAYTGVTNLAISPLSYNNNQWHQVVASQGADGMKLYIDGALVASNPNTGTQSYSGYWRIGGDVTWNSTSSYFNGTIDEAAVYGRVVPAGEIAQLYSLGSGSHAAPAASFTASSSNLTTVFDGSASAAFDSATITGYSWTFGGGGTDNVATPTHTFPGTGTYPVTLTVTDSTGATGSSTQNVTVTHPAPTVDFTPSLNQLDASVTATFVGADDATATTYTWNWGDATAATTSAVASATHHYAAAGTYTITLTVTDSYGVDGTNSHDVTASQHSAPVAAIGSTPTGLSVAFSSAGTTTSDGATITGYAWDFGDGGTATTANPVHQYASAATYPVSLVVTDSQGGVSTAATGNVTVTHANPVATMAATVNGLGVSVNSTGTTTSDGATVSSYSWNWGDNTAAGSGATATHTYAANGTFTITLTVTDSFGSTGTASAVVTVGTVVVPPVASDTFARTVATGWGTADVGGNWSATTGFSVSGGSGKILLSTKGQTRLTQLPGVSQADVDATVQFSTDKVADGGGLHFNLGVRQTNDGLYRSKVRISATGGVQVSIAKVVGTTETLLTNVTLAGYTYVAGDVLNVRLKATGSGTTTLSTKVWLAGTNEPAAWTTTKTDTTAALQGAGAVQMSTYLTGTATNAPVTVTVDNLSVVKP